MHAMITRKNDASLPPAHVMDQQSLRVNRRLVFRRRVVDMTALAHSPATSGILAQVARRR